VYTHISDPFLRSIITLDASSTRFHACERFNRCEHVDTDDGNRNVGTSGRVRHGTVSKTGKSVVYVNPVGMSIQRWEWYLRETRTLLERGEVVNSLVSLFP
jgi:DNA cross-link repair 1C protein